VNFGSRFASGAANTGQDLASIVSFGAVAPSEAGAFHASQKGQSNYFGQVSWLQDYDRGKAAGARRRQYSVEDRRVRQSGIGRDMFDPSRGTVQEWMNHTGAFAPSYHTTPRAAPASGKGGGGGGKKGPNPETLARRAQAESDRNARNEAAYQE